jgi:hypothetical protein
MPKSSRRELSLMQKYYSSSDDTVLRFTTVFANDPSGITRKRLARLKSGVRASSRGWNNLR